MSDPPVSVCQHTTYHQSFEADIELYSRLGVGGIELTERKLSTDPGERDEQLARLDDAGISIVTAQSRVVAVFEDSTYQSRETPEERMTHFRATIDLLGARYPGRPLTFVTVTGKAPGYDYASAYRTACWIYAELADHAAQHGFRIAFEPLHPIYMNTDTFICTLDDALGLIRDVDRPNFGLLLDTWHVWQEPNIADRVAALGDVLFGVHVSDYPAGGPRAQADRLVPGDGVIDLPALLGAAGRAGYDSSLCLEIFSDPALPDSLWRLDPAELLERGLAGLERARQAVAA